MILAPDINIQTYFLTSLLSESVFDDVLKGWNGAVRDESVAVVVSDSAQSFIDCQQSASLTGGRGGGRGAGRGFQTGRVVWGLTQTERAPSVSGRRCFGSSTRWCGASRMIDKLDGRLASLINPGYVGRSNTPPRTTPFLGRGPEPSGNFF